MGLRKGQINNPAGRPKGSTNKVSNELRCMITGFLNANFEEVVKIWSKADNPKDKMNFYRDLLRFAVPTLQATDIKTDFESMTDEQLDYIINKLKNENNE